MQCLARYQVVFNTNLNLCSFPNDSHELTVIIEDFIRGRDGLVSFFDSVVFSQFRFTLDVERDPAYFNLNVIFIMLLIVSMCFAVFFVSPGDLVSRLGLASTIFLSLVAHNYVVILISNLKAALLWL